MNCELSLNIFFNYYLLNNFKAMGFLNFFKLSQHHFLQCTEWRHSSPTLYHDWGETLEQGTELPTAPRHRSNITAHCSGRVFMVCVCVCSLLCVCTLGWVKCRAQIPSMGQHIWSQVTSFPFLPKKKINMRSVNGLVSVLTLTTSSPHWCPLFP